MQAHIPKHQLLLREENSSCLNHCTDILLYLSVLVWAWTCEVFGVGWFVLHKVESNFGFEKPQFQENLQIVITF